MISTVMDLPPSDTVGQPHRQEAPPEGAAQPNSPPPAVAADSELPGTIHSIQVLRFVAALIVVVFHAHVALMLNFPGHVPDQVDHAFKVGASGVHIFFVISGFVMVYTTLRSGLTPARFLKRRLIRIYPIYWLVAGAYLVIHQFLGTPYDLTPQQIAGAALLFPRASSLVIGPGWTLSFEMYFYLCFAIALFAGPRRGILALSFLYLASVAGGLVLEPQTPWGKLFTDSLLLEFMMGAFLGYAFSRRCIVSRRLGGILVLAGLALFGCGFWLDYDRLPSVISWGIPSLLLVTGSLAFEPELRSPVGRFFAKLGDSSYLLYLSHVLIIDLLLVTPIVALNRSLSAAIGVSALVAVLCTIIAAIGYEWIELPLLRALKRISLRESRSASRASMAG